MFARRVETPGDHPDLRMSTVGPSISRPDLLITRGCQVASLDISRTMKWFPDRLILLTLMPRSGRLSRTKAQRSDLVYVQNAASSRRRRD